MTEEPKPKKGKKIAKVFNKIWTFVDGHKTKIGTAIYFANELFGDLLPKDWSDVLKTIAELVIALGWGHYVYKGKDKLHTLKPNNNKRKTE